jgi:4-amino-4-deoxy-L-arabinose transferase-like glycosyltransferase
MTQTSPATTDPATARGGPPPWLLIFLAVITALRLILAAAIPLTEDEAYYRLWAQGLQLGYYDHPPMIAWWIRAGMSLAGDNAFGIRLVPTLVCGLSGLLVFDLAKRLGADVRTAARASLWYNATLVIGLGGNLATPDAAATPFWILTLWCLARTQRTPGPVWWLGAGLAAGLACLSKYSALFLAPGVVIWLVISQERTADLKRPWPWAAALIAATLFGINVAWNAQHHWVTFDKQFGRLAPHGLKPQYVLDLLLGQVLLLNPLITFFAIRGLKRPWDRSEQPGALDASLLVATSIPFATYLVFHALHDRVQAHWPVLIYPALAIIAAAAAGRIPDKGWLAGVRRWTAPVGLVLAGLVMIHLAVPATDIKGLNDPTGAIRGWPRFTMTVNNIRANSGAAWFGTVSYGATAQLDYARADAPVVQIDERDRYSPGDGSWRADMTRPGLIVDIDRRLSAQALMTCFAKVEPYGFVVRHLGVSRPTRYALFLVEGPRYDMLRDGCSGPRGAPRVE